MAGPCFLGYTAILNSVRSRWFRVPATTDIEKMDGSTVASDLATLASGLRLMMGEQ